MDHVEEYLNKHGAANNRKQVFYFRFSARRHLVSMVNDFNLVTVQDTWI